MATYETMHLLKDVLRANEQRTSRESIHPIVDLHPLNTTLELKLYSQNLLNTVISTDVDFQDLQPQDTQDFIENVQNSF